MDPWKACDIRGVYPSEVSPDLLRRAGAGIASLLRAGSRFLVAGDFRVSSPVLKDALTQGLIGSGGNVLDAGHLPTPIAYFAHRHWNTDAVLIVTASHNPKDHNGLKLMIGGLPPTIGDLTAIRECVEKGVFRRATGAIQPIDPVPPYRERILDRWGRTESIKGMRVVLDAGNGAWSELAPSLFLQLGFEVDRLSCRIDGSFPDRPPDCSRASNLRALESEVRKKGAMLGIAWDGDGDRVAFVDESGQFVSTDEISALLVRALVPAENGAKVVYDMKLSDLIRRLTLESGGVPLMERSGHTFIKRRMIQENGLFGCEVSGHYFLRELHGGDDGLFTALLVASLVGRKGSLGRMRRSLPPVFATPDLRLPAEVLTLEDVAARLHRHFTVLSEWILDGVRVETPHGFILVRESVTEPALTMRIEGPDKPALAALVAKTLEALPELAAEIRKQTW